MEGPLLTGSGALLSEAHEEFNSGNYKRAAELYTEFISVCTTARFTLNTAQPDSLQSMISCDSPQAC